MSNEMQFIIIVRFPEWQQEPIAAAGQTEVQKYSAFGVKYLLTMPVIPFPEWAADDVRWQTYSEEKIVKEHFLKAYAHTIKHKEFNGEILFVEPVDMTVLKHPDMERS